MRAESPTALNLGLTYAVVIFSIIVQGLMVGKLTARFVREAAAADEVEGQSRG